ncbi:MAG: deoxynucleoside kinase [Candidatus Cloacimonadales bacterium]|nr:deoxynucleoside kinase [Candidatus Cloacimonadales bacterium]
MEHLRIGIVGNIGVGKSTLVEAAAVAPLNEVLLSTIPNRTGEEQVFAFQEKFNSKVLDAFYADPVGNAFMAQIEFFNGRLDRQRLIEGCKGVILEDRTLPEDYHIFGMAQKILGNMSEEEFLAYQRNYNLMTSKIPEPDLIVYLKADISTLLDRIKERGRASEISIPSSYLEQLNELYELFIHRHVKCPVLVIDANVDTPLDEYLENTINKIAEEIRNLNLRVTTPGISKWVTLPETAATLKAIDAESRLEKYLQENPKLIAIAGNVGLGKSTLAAIMQRSLKINGLFENPEENPLLEKFLADKKTYCYDLQLHFLKMRKELQLKGKSLESSAVIDRSLPEDLLIFCYQFYQDGYLTANQLDDLTTRFKAACHEIPSPDLLIILKGRADLAWSRIQQRGREMEIEGGWSLSEIESLNELYRTYSKDVVQFGFHSGKVLEINVDQLDFTNRIHVGYIFDGIMETLK